MVNGRDFALKVWPDPEIQRIQIGERCGPLLIGNEVRNILWKPLLSLFGPIWWWRVILKRPGTVFEVRWYPGQQCTNKDGISIVLLVKFYPLINKKEETSSWLCYGCSDHHWGWTLLPSHHTGSFIPIPRPNSIILGLKLVFNIEFLLITENEVYQIAILNAGKKNLASLESFINNLRAESWCFLTCLNST